MRSAARTATEHIRGRLARAKQSETRLRRELSGLRDDLKQLEQRVARLEHGQARLEGLLEGLREAITQARAAS